MEFLIPLSICLPLGILYKTCDLPNPQLLISYDKIHMIRPHVVRTNGIVFVKLSAKTRNHSVSVDVSLRLPWLVGIFLSFYLLVQVKYIYYDVLSLTD